MFGKLIKSLCCAVILCTACSNSSRGVYGAVADFKEAEAFYKNQGGSPQVYETGDGQGNTVKVLDYEDILYVTAREAVIRKVPQESGEVLHSVLLGTKLTQSSVCSNGWSKVVYEEEGEQTVIGYVETSVLSDRSLLTRMEDQVVVAQDTNILDYPGQKDGEVIGEALEYDELLRTATVNGVWSRVVYENESGIEKIGYLPTSTLKDQDEEITVVARADAEQKGAAGVLSESGGGGVFADAVEGVKEVSDEEATVAAVGVRIGAPVSVSSDASLKSLGYFRITHYCPCSICCGPWANGITSTGVTAVTNHTIAVDPSQIPYGSRVVINGQVYVAEDCGGAIKKDCIDVYVASHAEGESKGVYYTEVYLIE